MNNIPIIIKRRLQAEVVGPLFKEMVDQLGQHKAERILESAIQKAAIDEGRRFATQVASSNQSPLRRFIDLFEQWTTGGGGSASGSPGSWTKKSLNSRAYV